MIGLGIKLSDEGQELILRFIIDGEQGNIPFDELPLPDEEDLDAHPAFVDAVAEHIAIGEVRHGHLLFFHGCLDMLDLIPEFHGALEFHLFRGFLHLHGKLLLDLLISAIQETGDFIRHLAVGFIIHFLDARRQALSHMVVKACPVRQCCTFSQWIQAIEQFFRFVRGSCIRIRTEVPSLAALHLAGGDEPWVTFVGQLDERVAFIIFEHDVVFRVILLDEVHFEHECFEV